MLLLLTNIFIIFTFGIILLGLITYYYIILSTENEI